jgi:hypothetical protein
LSLLAAFSAAKRGTRLFLRLSAVTAPDQFAANATCGGGRALRDWEGTYAGMVFRFIMSAGFFMLFFSRAFGITFLFFRMNSFTRRSTDYGFRLTFFHALRRGFFHYNFNFSAFVLIRGFCRRGFILALRMFNQLSFWFFCFVSFFRHNFPFLFLFFILKT